MEAQSNPRTISVLRSFVKTAVFITTSISLAALIGWVFDIPFLRSILPNAAPMKVNTALGFCCASISLWLLQNENASSRQKRIGRIFALVVILIGCLSLSEYLFKWDLGIDQLLIKNLAASLNAIPNRMSPVTAICFVLIGVGWLLIGSKLSQYFSISVVFLSLVALIGYLFNSQALYELPGYGSIAFPTAFTFLILSLATLAMRPTFGVMRLMIANLIGGKAVRFLLPVTILLIIILGWAVEQAERLKLVSQDYESVILVLSLILIYSPLIYFYASRINRMEAQFLESEKLFRTAFQFSPVGMCLTTLDGKLQNVNQSLADMLGFAKEELENKHFNDITYPVDREIGKEALQRMMSGEVPNISFEKRYVQKTGTAIWTYVSITLLRDSSSKPLHFITQILDIDKRKKAEEELRESEERFRTLIEQSSEGITLVSEAGNVLEWNQAMEQITGIPKTQAIGLPVWEMQAQMIPSEHRSPQSKEHAKDMFSKMLETGSSPHLGKRLDLEIQTMNGKRKNVTQTIFAIQTEHGHRIGSVVLDITELKQAVNELLFQNVLLTTEREVSLDGIMIVDEKAQIISYNHQFAEMWNIPSSILEEKADEPILKLVTNQVANPDLFLQRVQYLYDHKQEISRDELLLLDGRVFDRYSSPMFGDDERYFGRTWYFRNITERKRYEEQLRTLNAELEQRVTERTAELHRMNSELEHANRAKDEFLANMSHELRTPLNSVLGLSESLLEQRRGSLNEYQQRSLQIIESSGNHLLELINDILDLSKIEAGKLDFYPQPVLVDDLCRSSLAFVKAQATKKSITLSYVDESSISKIFADSRRLKQVLVNLLTNAVKFTPEKGHVTLQVNAKLEQDLIQFSVIDDGVGIAPKDLQRLFHPFVQVDSSLNRQHDGTGLGLALVQRLTDLHGGSVRVESEVGKGSQFTINLACNQDEIAKLEKLQSQTASPVREPSKKIEISETPRQRGVILLAEDNMPNVLTIGEYLESHAYEIVVAHDGLEAIEKASAVNPDMILMDIQMPVMNGLEAIAHLRADLRFASTPIIALTALAMPGDRERCLQVGATEYMSKPVSLKMLLRVIESLIPAVP